MQAEISCQGVRKVYGRGPAAFEAVAAATFSIEKGEFVCLLGPSGCGKSTLLMMIAGLEGVTDGRILAGGTAMTEPRAEIGIVFQDPTLLPWKTTLQNVSVSDRDDAQGPFSLPRPGDGVAASRRA